MYNLNNSIEFRIHLPGRNYPRNVKIGKLNNGKIILIEKEKSSIINSQVLETKNI